MNYILTLIMLSLIIITQANAQIISDRPSQAMSPNTTGKHVLQGQHGFDYLKNSNHSILAQTQTLYNENVIRFGITNRLEVNTLFTFQSDRIDSSSSQYEQSGLSNFQVGIRANLIKQKKWYPTVGFQTRFKFPTISKAYGTSHVAPDFILSTSKNFPNKTAFTTNWILTYNGSNPNSIKKYVVNYSFPIYRNVTVFIENYGQLYLTTFETRFDAGLAYLIGSNLQLDLSGGYGSNNGITDFFMSTGISWRLNLKRKSFN